MGNLDEDSQQNFFEDRSKVVALVLLFGGLFLLAIGIGLVFFPGQSKSSDVELIASTSGAVSDVKTSAEIAVDIDGAVAKPGLYKMASDLRINDLVSLAGGLLDTADRAQVNLAGKIVDEQKVHIPELGEVAVTGFGKLNKTLVNNK